MREIRHTRRRNDSGGIDMHAGIAQARGEHLGNPRTGFAGVLADHNAPRALRQMVAKRLANGVNSPAIKREFTRHSANTVCSKKFSQPGSPAT